MTTSHGDAWCSTTPKRQPPAAGAASSLKSVGTALDVLECFATDGELGVSDIARNSLRHAALPTIRQIAATTGLTVNFSVVDGPDVVFVERIENHAGVRILDRDGVAVAALSFFGPTDEIRRKIERLVPLLQAASRRIARAHQHPHQQPQHQH